MGWAGRYIEALGRGETVSFRPHGVSMRPRIESGDLCTVAPLAEGEPVVGDVVLCRVRGREVLHLVLAVRDGQYQIGNARRHVNRPSRRTAARVRV